MTDQALRSSLPPEPAPFDSENVAASDCGPPAGALAHAAAKPEDGPDVGSADPTDGRGKCEWKSRYPKEAKDQIRGECWYIVLLLVSSLLLIFATWQNLIADAFSLPQANNTTFRKYSYYCFSGLLGGTVYGMKYLYRVVARGYWNEDRKPWRYMSPYIALAISFAFGALIDGKFLSVNADMRASSIIGVGFLVGYFADRAIGKLHDIADVVFGHTGARPKEQTTAKQS